MAIFFDIDPYFNTIQTAYNPIPYTAEDDGATGIPPVVYCDVYFDFTYYKTLTSTSPAQISGPVSFWKFDISGLAQEYMITLLPDITGTSPATMYVSGGPAYGATVAYVKFRISTQDSFGVITPGGVAPVQATVDSPAIAGDGWQTDTFMIINSAQQATDIIALESQLKAFRISGAFIGGFFPQNVDPLYRVYPLSYLKKQKIYKNDYGMLPVLCCRNAFLGLHSAYANIYIFGFSSPGVITYIDTVSSAYMLVDYSIFYLPVGLVQILAMFPIFTSVIGHTQFYQIALGDPAYSGVNKFMFISPKYYIQQQDGSEPAIMPLVQPVTPKHTRVWFQNYLGHLDQIIFVPREETLKVTSSPTELPMKFATNGYAGKGVSMSRNNVRSNEYNVITGLFLEEDIPFVKQLLASAKTYLEFISPESGEVPPVALLLPIVIVDGEYSTQTFDDRYEYMIQIKYFMSNEFKIVRN